MNDKTTILEIPEAEVPKLAKAIEDTLRQLRQFEEEDQVRQQRIAALGAETDQLLKQIKTNLAYVEEHLRSPLPDFYLR